MRIERIRVAASSLPFGGIVAACPFADTRPSPKRARSGGERPLRRGNLRPIATLADNGVFHRFACETRLPSP